jgi:hypothetical protein
MKGYIVLNSGQLFSKFLHFLQLNGQGVEFQKGKKGLWRIYSDLVGIYGIVSSPGNLVLSHR